MKIKIGVIFARNLLFFREKQRMSQSELEKNSGIKREYISKLEHHELKNPTINTVAKLADGLGVLPEDLIYNEITSSNRASKLCFEVAKLEQKQLEQEEKNEQAVQHMAEAMKLLDGHLRLHNVT